MSAPQRSFWNGEEDISSEQPHFDILSGLHGIKREVLTVWKYRHIAGHQEDSEGTILNIWSLLNIEYDMKSKEYWSVLKRGGYETIRDQKSNVASENTRHGSGYQFSSVLEEKYTEYGCF